MIVDYDDYSREELIHIILNQNDYISELENKIDNLQDERDSKSARDLEANRILTSELLTNLVKEIDNGNKDFRYN